MPKAVVSGVRRHSVSYRVARVLLTPLFSLLFRFRADRQPCLPSPYLVISNHVTEYDFFLVGRSFSRPMYFVISETLYRNRYLSLFLRVFFSPILKRKGMSDAGAAMALARRLRAGKNVCLFAEGNTTFDGRTGRIPPSTVGLLQASGAGLVTYRIEGGYFSLPRWGYTLRRGRTRGIVVQQYTRDELAAMDPARISAAIEEDLSLDAYAQQAKDPIAYRGRRAAEGLEHALYLCPECSKIGMLRSQGSHLTCDCGLLVRYTEYGYLEGNSPFRTIADWTRWQKARLREQAQSGNGPVLCDGEETLYRLEGGHRLSAVATGTMCMDCHALSVGSFRLPLRDIAGMAVFRKNILLFSDTSGNSYELAARRTRNALKYRDLFEILGEKKG